jgi:hypothetical protein
MSVVPEYSWKGISGQLADRGLDIRDYLGLVPKFKRVIRSIALPAGLERATQNFAPLLQALALPGPAPMNKRRHPPSRFFSSAMSTCIARTRALRQRNHSGVCHEFK